MSALTVVVLAHVSILVESMSVVRLCWILGILYRRLRRGGGVARWEDVNYRDSWCLGVCIGLVLCIVYGSFALCGCSTIALG